MTNGNRRVKAKCGGCGATFYRWRGDGQRNKADADLRCKSCRIRAYNRMMTGHA